MSATLVLGTLIGAVAGLFIALLIYLLIRQRISSHCDTGNACQRGSREEDEGITSDVLERILHEAKDINESSTEIENRVVRLKDLQRIRDERLKKDS